MPLPTNSKRRLDHLFLVARVAKLANALELDSSVPPDLQVRILSRAHSFCNDLADIQWLAVLQFAWLDGEL